jgi:tetratricopeptide (TPR) repeat protein
MESIIGRTIAHYEILELLGIGGAAEVYRAHDVVGGREVALKLLSDRADPAMVLRFAREAKALARLDHPHIVKTFDAGVANGQRYLAMELVRGGSLKERLQRGPLEWHQAVRLAAQVAQALAHAHAAGVIHRDLKPGNIMLDDEGTARLMDFGLAHVSDASAMTRTGTVMGTVYYLSPEQAVGKRVDARSDLYSLGAVLYEMVTGLPPFTGPSAVSIIYKILNEPAPRLRDVSPSLPPLLDGLVDRLLQKDASRRFGDAAETLLALETVERYDPRVDSISQPIDAEALVQAPRERGMPLVGREEELDALHDGLDRAVSGLGRTVLISGEAGTGKTRLANELRRLGADVGALFLAGDCLYGDAPNPYAVLVDMLRTLRECWPALDQEGSEAPEDEVSAALREVERVLRIDSAGTSTDDANWLQQVSLLDGQNQAFELITQLFTLASRRRPLVLVMDDLQWASQTTLQLFHYLARALRGTRTLLVGIYRPEELLPGASGDRHPLRETLQRMGREKLYVQIELKPMGSDDVGLLAANALHVASVDPDFVELLHRESDGNPFFLLETIALLQEQGALERVDDHWELHAGVAEIDIPSSVYDVVMRRVEQATPEDRDLLDWAAVIGQRLNVDVLTAVVGGTRLGVMKRLFALEQRYGLLDADPSGFQFSHAKVREVLYEALPEALRRECHLTVGEALEAQCEGRPGAAVYDLARHFVAAGDRPRGFRYAVIAADKAEKALAAAEAAGYLSAAVAFLAPGDDLGGGGSPEMELQHRHGRLLAMLGRLEEAETAFKAALDISQAQSDQRMQSIIVLALSGMHGRGGDWAGAIQLGERSLALAESAGYHEGRADALLSTGFFAFEQGDWHGAVARLRAALAIATEHGHEVQRARILGNLAIMYNARGRPEQAIDLYRESIDTFDRLDKPLDVARGLSNLGFSYHSLAQYDRALACYREALDRLGRTGDVRERGLLYLHIAETSLAQGDVSTARENCTLAARRFARLGFDLGIADVDRVYAGVAIREGRWQVAERYLREALSVYQEHGDQLNIAETHEELSKLLEERGHSAQAEEELSRSRLIFERLFETSTSEN